MTARNTEKPHAKLVEDFGEKIKEAMLSYMDSVTSAGIGSQYHAPGLEGAAAFLIRFAGFSYAGDCIGETQIRQIMKRMEEEFRSGVRDGRLAANRSKS